MEFLHFSEASAAWSRVRMSGPDAQDYLHRMTTADVRHLRAGEVTSGCFLNAQGKIRAVFQLACLAPGELILELDAGPAGAWKKALLEVIEQFHFAENFTVSEDSEPGCSWFFSGTPGAPGCRVEDGVTVIQHGDALFGRAWTSVWGSPQARQAWREKHAPGATALTDPAQLQLWRIEALGPWTDAEIRDGANPLEVGLRSAVADNKGCYPGQEVIEKIVALGSPARRLVRIEGQGQPPTVGQPLLGSESDATVVGELTSVAARPGADWVGLGVVRKTHARDGQELRTASASGRVTRIARYE